MANLAKKQEKRITAWPARFMMLCTCIPRSYIYPILNPVTDVTKLQENSWNLKYGLKKLFKKQFIFYTFIEGSFLRPSIQIKNSR